MPMVRLLTWNSRGESPYKAQVLRNLILQNPVVQNWHPDIIVIQEAHASPNGAIYTMLAQLHQQSQDYPNRPPNLVALDNSESYLLMTSTQVQINNCALADLWNDPGVQGTIGAYPQPTRGALQFECQHIRYPATAQLTHTPSNTGIRFATWHAPRGPTPVFLGISAKVDYDAYYFLQVSNHYQALLNPAQNSVSIIAGDMNATVSDFVNPTHTGVAAIQQLLPGWDGRSFNLDHIFAYPANRVRFQNVGAHPAHRASDHEILVGEVHY